MLAKSYDKFTAIPAVRRSKLNKKFALKNYADVSQSDRQLRGLNQTVKKIIVQMVKSA
ncbi:MAG: hypothetical protein ACJAW1_002800 [Glaciecola sp.]